MDRLRGDQVSLFHAHRPNRFAPPPNAGRTRRLETAERCCEEAERLLAALDKHVYCSAVEGVEDALWDWKRARSEER